MEIFRDPLGRDEPPRGAIVSIGNFDGVHMGHQAVLRLVAERARDLGVDSAAMTLNPHPVKLLRPTDAPPLLSPMLPLVTWSCESLGVAGRGGASSVEDDVELQPVSPPGQVLDDKQDLRGRVG